MRELIQVGPLRLDMRRCEVITPHKTAYLTPLEMWLLGYLAERVNTTVSAREISEDVWDDGGESRATMKVLVHHIQRKIEQDFMHPLYLLTVPGEGYRLVMEVCIKKETKKSGYHDANDARKTGTNRYADNVLLP